MDRRVAGAISAYRGFRRQALYALWRLLESPDSTLRPEGVEDLAVWEKGVLTDAVQVKSLSVPLVLSDLEPQSPGSFFHAADARHRAGGNERLKVVSFGPLGPELEGFAAGDQTARANIQAKLRRAGISATSVGEILNRLAFEVVDDANLRADVTRRLGQLLTGIDPDVAFDLLTLWIYIESEGRGEISRVDVQERLVAVGRFLADRQQYHAHWFTSIQPILEPNLTDEQRSRFATEFYQGVAVRYEHVSVGLAVDRPERLAEFDRAFAKERIVIVHAASGQGKTTLAYLFMRQLPETWRFSVRLVESRVHAIEVAQALAGHAKAMGLPLFVHVDVGPRDIDWPTLVRELAAEPQIRVLVTIREEDWGRSTDTWAFPSSDVDLAFSKGEATGIYDGLRGRFRDVPPTFDEAWSRFGGAGPLLEFVYLVTQRQDLPSRLRDQVEALRLDAERQLEPGVIEFLRLVAVVSESGARAFLRPLADLAGLHDSAHVLGRLEQEYLVRQTDDGVLVGGLHPVRSRILADILTDPDLNSRSEVIVRALPFVTERDLEALLLHALDVDEPGRQAVLEAVSRLAPATWAGIAGVGRALRWRGVADYADDHRPLIEEIDPAHTGRWGVILNGDIADAMPGTADEIWETVRSLARGSTQASEGMESQRVKQKPGSEAFVLFRRWLEEHALPMGEPALNEWSQVGEVLFFASHLGVQLRGAESLTDNSLDRAVTIASVDDLAALSLGLGDADRGWRTRNRSALIETFRREMGVTRFSDDGVRLTIDFLHPVGGSSDPTADGPRMNANSNQEAVVRLDLLRRLLPDRERYASQGWGHRVIDAAPDGTQKDIDRLRLPPLWLTSINAMFRGYVERWWRDPSWSAYLTHEIERRSSICDRLERITTALVRYHRRRTGVILGVDLTESEFRDWSIDLSHEHLLPRSAVDRWGFVDESSLRSGAQTKGIATAYGLALQPYDSYHRAHRDYYGPLSNFAEQAVMTLVVKSVLGRTRASDQDATRARLLEEGANLDTPRLSVVNLLHAYEQLPALQVESRRLFGSGVPEALELREERTLLRAVETWESFVRHPWRHSDDIATESSSRIDQAVRSLRKSILAGLAAIDEDLTWSFDLFRDARIPGCMLVGVDGSDGTAVYAALEAGVKLIHEVLATAPEQFVSHVRSRWPRIVLVPTIWRRPVAAEAIELSTPVVSGTDWERQWWHFVPRPLDPALRHLLPDEPWSLEGLQTVERLSTAIGTLGSVALHLSDLQPPEGLDPVGAAIFREHVSSLIPTPLAAWRDARSVAAEFRRLVEAEPREGLDREVFLEIASALEDGLLAAPGWPEGEDPRHSQLAAWAPALGQLFALVGLARVGWTTVVVARERERQLRMLAPAATPNRHCPGDNSDLAT